MAIVGRKQAIGWILIAASGLMSVGIFAQAIVERQDIPVSSPNDTPVVPLAPIEGE